MTRLLTSWKEIAQYLGKSIRTVQRWEREVGLPVGPANHQSGMVFADTDELDKWFLALTLVRTTTKVKAQSTRLTSAVLVPRLVGGCFFCPHPQNEGVRLRVLWPFNYC